jgi:hypothetical protein
MLLRILANQEEPRQTMRVVLGILQSIQNHLGITGGTAMAQLPEGMAFTMKTEEDVHNIEREISNTANKTVLVG